MGGKDGNGDVIWFEHNEDLISYVSILVNLKFQSWGDIEIQCNAYFSNLVPTVLETSRNYG